MTYKEFKQIVEDTFIYSVTEDKDYIYVNMNTLEFPLISVSKKEKGRCDIHMGVNTVDGNKVLKSAVELVETPLDEREPEKKYYLRHKFLVSTLNVLGTYLIDRNNVYSLGLLDYYPDHQTQFTKKKIEEIKKKYDVTLSDFELIEVEE